MKKVIILAFFFLSLNNYSQEIEFGKVSKKELEEKFHPKDSTANAAYLYRKRKTYYEFNETEGGFEVITEIHNRIKIYNKDGFDKANLFIGYYKPISGKEEKVSSLKGYSFNIENGKVNKQKLSKSSIFNEELSKYRSAKKITFPNIKVGTVLDIKYKLISPYERSIDELEFQFDIPVKKLEYKIEIPEYYVFNKKAKGYYNVPSIKSRKNTHITLSSKETSGFGINAKINYNRSKIDFIKNIDSYSATNIPALKNNEPFVGSIKSYRGGLKYELEGVNFLRIGGNMKSYSNTWEAVSKQIYKSSNFGGQIEKTNYFKNDLPTVIQAATTDIEKTFAIFQFVKSKVKWNEYYGKYTDNGVKKAYKEGVGNVADINLMLTSMLREAGLKANPVLVSTRKNGVPLFPTLDGFNYVITIVDLPNNKYILLDATEPYSTPNILPVRALNWNGRKVTKDGSSSWVKLTSSNLALEENNISVKISEDGIISGLLRTRYNNLNALNYRKAYNHLNDDALIKKLEEKNNIEIENFRITNKTKISKPLSLMSKFSSEDLVEEINSKLYINPLLFLTQNENPFKSNERKFPVDFASPWKDNNKVSIQIPSGYKVEFLPEPLAIGLPDELGLFKFKVTENGNKINIQSLLQFNSAIITPEYYAILKELYGKIVAKQSEKIILVKQ